MVKPGGYFVTCSCSHYMNEELIKHTISEAATDAHKTSKTSRIRTQSCRPSNTMEFWWILLLKILYIPSSLIKRLILILDIY